MAPHVLQPAVLHVEDSDVNRHVRRWLLERAGFSVFEATTMREALAAVLEHRPDVVLTDILLPDGSGFDLTQQIRTNPLVSSVRVVQISASFTDAEYRVRGLDSGADAYLIEPIDPAELVAVLRTIVRGRRTDDLLNTIIQRAPMLVAGADRCGKIVLFNPACEALTGHTREDVIGKPFVDTLISPADRDDVARRFIGAESSNQELPHEVRWRTAAGDDRLIEWRTFAVASPDGATWTLGIGHNVTAARQAQNARRLSERHLRTVIDNTAALVYVVDASGRLMLVNRAFGAMFNLESSVISGRSLYDLFGNDTARQFEENNEAILRTGTAIEYEEVVPHADGLHTYISVKAPLFDESGMPYAICGVSTDITERKRLEEDLKRADRRKDEFIATVAHELRQPLAPIVTALELAKRRISEKATGQAFEVIDRQVHQMERLIEDLLDASRIAQGKVAIRATRIALNEVVANAVSVVGPLIREREQELTLQAPDDVVWMNADPNRLQQVFSNLLTNASKFTPRLGRIVLAVEPGDEAVTVRVSDNGRGIAPELLPRIFDLFTQSTTDERGIGVGLAVVRGLVERHGGTVTAHSDGPGKGSEFVVRLPRLDDQRELSDEGASQALRSQNS